ncbi:MAG: hypothetical protein H8F28_03850 [Fibrella sp.]|nr:hypothetical protein [Armatimonadota bacterium]
MCIVRKGDATKDPRRTKFLLRRGSFAKLPHQCIMTRGRYQRQAGGTHVRQNKDSTGKGLRTVDTPTFELWLEFEHYPVDNEPTDPTDDFANVQVRLTEWFCPPDESDS